MDTDCDYAKRFVSERNKQQSEIVYKGSFRVQMT